MLRRGFSKCLLRPEDIPPSDSRLEVVGTFNPGAIAVEDGIVLLIRVAERPKETRDGMTALPRYEPGSGLVIDWMANDDLNFVDPRVVEVKPTGTHEKVFSWTKDAFVDPRKLRMKTTGDIRLTFLSHIVVAHSKDGRSVDSIADTRFHPDEAYESYGVEDPRITPLEGAYYITYSAYSRHGVRIGLAKTLDFESVERIAFIAQVDYRNTVLFPERINGRYDTARDGGLCLAT